MIAGANSIRFHISHRFCTTNLAPPAKLYLELSDDSNGGLPSPSPTAGVRQADIDSRKSIIGRVTCDKRRAVPAMHRYSTGHYRTAQ